MNENTLVCDTCVPSGIELHDAAQGHHLYLTILTDMDRLVVNLYISFPLDAYLFLSLLIWMLSGPVWSLNYLYGESIHETNKDAILEKCNFY
jgi:hypothetical protein